jgi:hypothetical protein
LLCALADGVQLNGWPLPDLPRRPLVRWHWRPAARMLAAAGAFLAGAALIPVPVASAKALQRLQADQTAGALREQMAILAEEDLASPEQLRAWQEQLRHALENADGQDPVKTWEALDYLGEALAGKTSESLRSAQEWEAAMQQAETALAAMAALAARDAMSAAEQCRALGLLADQLRKAAEQAGTALPPELQQALQEALAGAARVALTAEQLRRLSELLRRQREARQLSPEQLARLRCLSPEELQALLDNLEAGAGDCPDPEALAAFLCDLPAGACVSAEGLLAACTSGLPGTGGVSRGRGDAALTWSGHTEPAAEALNPEALPAAGRLDLEQAHVQGVSYAAPQEKTDATLSAGVLTAAGGVSRARTHTVLPRHRSAVEAYFERSR